MAKKKSKGGRPPVPEEERRERLPEDEAGERGAVGREGRVQVDLQEVEARARARAAAFSWHRCAAETLAVLESLAPVRRSRASQ